MVKSLANRKEIDEKLVLISGRFVVSVVTCGMESETVNELQISFVVISVGSVDPLPLLLSVKSKKKIIVVTTVVHPKKALLVKNILLQIASSESSFETVYTMGETHKN